MHYLWLICVLFVGCQKYSLSVSRETVDRGRLASSFVGSPDPLQDHPPRGQRLIVEWSLPDSFEKEQPNVALDIIFRNFTEKSLVFPVKERRGRYVFDLLDDDYRTTHGFMTYRARLLGESGKIMKEWKPKLWFEVIHIDE